MIRQNRCAQLSNALLEPVA